MHPPFLLRKLSEFHPFAKYKGFCYVGYGSGTYVQVFREIFSHNVCTKMASQRRTARVLLGGPIIRVIGSLPALSIP